MLKSYQRRAFLVLAVVALEPLAVPIAHAEEPKATEPETLWETLNHVDRNSDKKSKAVADPDEPTLVPLGAVPGFSLPSLDRVGTNSISSTSNSKKKSYRGPFGTFSRLWDTFLTSTGSKIDIKGDASLAFRQDSVSGGAQASQTFQDQYYYGQGSNGVYANTSMHVDATLFKYFHYDSTISNSPYRSPGENRVKLDYNTKKVRFQVGDINAGFQGNSLIDFNRYLSGVELENKWTNSLKTTMLFSHTKAETKTLTSTGNDSAGPYYLFSGQIVDGSAHVRVDNRDMVPGKDYTLDSNTGLLQFLNGNVILHSQTIAITYETQGYNQSQGTIYGFRTQYTPHGGNNVGLTYVTQQTRALSGTSLRTQQFYGVENAGGPYTMDSAIDSTKPLEVTVNGVPLVQGTAATGEYWLDSVFPTVIHLRNPIPSTQQVIVKYVPLDTNPNPGNRSVMGLDGHLSMGKWGGLTLETAFSGLDLSGKTFGGKAAQVRADLTPLRNLTTHITVRDVGATYSSVQTPGFNRNEKSLEIGGDYSPISRLHLNYDWQNAKRPSYSYGSGIATGSQYNIISAGNDTYKSYSLGVSYDIARSARLSLTRNTLGTDYLAGGFSKSTSDTLDFNWSFRKFSIDTALSRNVADTNAPNGYYGVSLVPGATATGAAASGAYSSQSSTLTKRVGLTWNPLRWLSLNSSLSDNDIHNTGTGYTGALAHTNATDRQITARITPGRGLSFLYSYDLSDTGTANTLGTVTTAGTGTTATGVATATGGTTTGTGTTATGTTGTTGVSGTGVGGTRASFFRPWTRAVTRDNITGNTTTGFGTTALPTVLTPVSSLGGGGINSNLGAAGSYSGYLSNGYSNLGVTSLGGRSTTNRLGMDYAISHALHLNMSYDIASSVGDYQYNSNRNNATLGMNYNPSDRWAFNFNINTQKVAYNGSLGGTNSSTMQFGFTGRPFGNKITTTINWQSVRSKSALNLAGLTSGATPTGSITAGTVSNPLVASSNNANSNLSSLGARIDVPVSSRYTLFVDWLSSNATGYLGNTESDLRFGTDIYLNQVLKFSLGWQTVNRVNTDSTLSNYNYHSSSLLAEFGLHF